MARENAISLPPMRAWQQRCVEQIREAIRQGHKRIVVQSPTGAGKTLLAAHLFAGSIAKGKRPMFTVPDITLVEQTLQSFARVGIHDVGVIQAQHERTDWNAQVQIASVQTLIRRALPEVDLVVVDECHVQCKGLYDLLDGEAWKDKIVIGLSATPWARGMGLHWTKLIIGATIKELIDEGILCGFRAFAPQEEINRSSLHLVKGEFDEHESSVMMQDARIVGDVVATWKKYECAGRAFMFCVDRAHARAQQSAFEQAGIPFGYIDGTMSIEERKPIFESFREGRILGIASVGCLSRGVDEDVHVIIDAQPTNSEMAYVQKIGRGLRNPNGGKTLLILDHAGNTALGLVTDIHHESLDSRKPGDRTKPFAGDTKAKKPHKCPTCNALVPYGRAKCSVCGGVLKAVSHTRHAPGELAEYNYGTKRSVQKPVEDQQAWFSGFLGLARERGHSDGWAAHRFKLKFGDWPNRLRKEPVEPSFAVRQYDKYQRIKWAKSKQKERADA